MKNSILTIFAIGTLLSCEKKENTNLNNSVDSTSVAMDRENATTDSATVAVDSASTVVNLTEQDKKFADEAATGGMMEVMLGELASTQASNSSVKSLGAMMVKDHTKANAELKSWASKNGYSLPTNMTAEQQKMYDDLKAKKGADFDKAYANAMVNDHKKDVAAFKKQASDGGDATLKAFASKTVPTLEHHLMESEKTKEAVK